MVFFIFLDPYPLSFVNLISQLPCSAGWASETLTDDKHIYLYLFFNHQGIQGNVGMRGNPGFMGERVSSSYCHLSRKISLENKPWKRNRKVLIKLVVLRDIGTLHPDIIIIFFKMQIIIFRCAFCLVKNTINNEKQHNSFFSLHQGEQGLRGLPGPAGKQGPTVSVWSSFYILLLSIVQGISLIQPLWWGHTKDSLVNEVNQWGVQGLASDEGEQVTVIDLVGHWWQSKVKCPSACPLLASVPGDFLNPQKRFYTLQLCSNV